MVLRRYHRQDDIAVRKHLDRAFLADEAVLDDNALAGCAELLPHHHRINEVQRLLDVRANLDTLPEGVTVCLDDNRRTALTHIVRGVLGVVKDPEGLRAQVMPGQKLVGECL